MVGDDCDTTDDNGSSLMKQSAKLLSVLDRCREILPLAIPGCDRDQGGGKTTHDRLYCTDCGAYEYGFDSDGEPIIEHDSECLYYTVFQLLSDVNAVISEVTGKQPPPNENWCIGCSPDNCPGCENKK
ncbi:MAG: hypothetical protein ACXWAS_12505, partial [Methylobacter sp.]